MNLNKLQIHSHFHFVSHSNSSILIDNLKQSFSNYNDVIPSKKKVISKNLFLSE